MWTPVAEKNFTDFSWQPIANLGTEEIFLFDYELGDEEGKYQPRLSCRFIYQIGPGLFAVGKTWRIYPRITVPDLRLRIFPSQYITAGMTDRKLEIRVLQGRSLSRWNETEAFDRIQSLNLRVQVWR